ncbi:sarcosine oxidase subunit gamma [uncultured Roseobacter sp.]|uniref:sarcosine oxidase subunit gamma n=1 Tax=uncultured Roseobacter sp. TaxID=114847 RepID=UPI00262B2E8F|nr:sarcosine oxidase subunit gamma [uncultured Roseobacter sp.]
MGDLIAKSAFGDLLPLSEGAATLSDAEVGHLTSIAPFQGQTTATSQALRAAHGMALPAVNRATGKAFERAIWFGKDMALLVGPPPNADLARTAALTDQSDAWACVTLDGPPAEDILARLVPVDLRAAEFKRGHTVRTQIRHMNGSITRVGSDSFLIMVFRSMAITLVQDIKQAMEATAARR